MEEEPQEELFKEDPQQEMVEEEPEETFVEEEEEEAGEDEVEYEKESRPAVVINVRSWGTLVVGLVMLLIGFAGGIAGRSILDSINNSGSAAAPVASEPAIAASTEAPGGAIAQIPSVTPQQPSPEDQEQLMSFLVSQTKHFIGDPDAPVTIIEFSDFQ